ncbi:MAG TPA: AAA family ATPase, partial [Methylomirabilota bacterium]
MVCPQCQQANPSGAKFCSSCGGRLAVTCPACGHANIPGSRFCNDCGAVLDSAASPQAPAPAAYTPPHLTARILTSRSALEGERKQVTVLFADLKGSLELLADRDPEEARQLLDPVLERMMESVHRYEGTVNQVMGDGIMALFGAPLAHEDHALRACYAALRMQEQVGKYGDETQRAHGVPIQIRVGLNSGDVVVRAIGSDLRMDYSAIGQTTHLAARMEQIAKPGSVLMTPATLRLVEGYVEVKPIGPVAIKGLGVPIEVFELGGVAVSRTRLQVSAGRGLTRFVGRDAELGQLHTALERAGSGHGQVVALIGEPGAGKSRLVWELTHSHRTHGWLVLEAASVSYGKATPFLPVIEMLRRYFGVEGHDDARHVREKLTGRLLTLDEGLRPVLPAFEALLVDDTGSVPGIGDGARGPVRDAVKRLLLKESERQPLMLVFEDLHWLDPDSQALLDSLVESLPSHRVLLVVNYRPEYRHEWGSKSSYAQIRLDPLGRETAEILLDSLLGHDATLAALRALLVERADGNPLFLEESVRGLAETGVLAGERGAYRLARAVQGTQVPATVQAILAARIDRLAPEDKALLQVASVVGKDVPVPLLEAIGDLPPDELDRRLKRLQAAELMYEARLFPDAEYTFKHALTHEVAYASMLAERRRALHARVVEAMERYPEHLPEDRARLVHHAFRGEVWSKALAHLRTLGEAASPTQIDQVMGQGPESPGQLWWAGEHERAVKAAERDLAVGVSFGNFAMRVVATCRLGQANHSLGNYDVAANLLRQTVDSLQGDLERQRFGMAAFPSVWARSWLAYTLAERGEFAQGTAIGEEGSRIAEAADDLYSRAQATFGLGTLYLAQGRADQAIQVLEEGLVIARLEGIPFLVPFITGPLGAAYAQAGQPDRGIPLLEQTVEQAAEIRLLAGQALRLVWLGDANLRAGRAPVALGLARRALQLAEDRQERGHLPHALCLVGDTVAAGETGDLEGASSAYRQALAKGEALGMEPLVARCRLALGEVDLRAGEKTRAREHFA